MNDKSILQRLSDDGHEAPRVRLDDDAAAPETSERYQIVGEIARGGVGVVYKGRDSDLGRDVAMKLLRDDYLEHPELIQRFVEEAQVGGQLQHPGIVPVYELGIKDGNRPYFAMKLVKGRTLAELLGERKDPTVDRRALLAHFAQVCQTVAYAHSRGVIHRDLKPANIMVGGFGEVQVVDWGFAKVLQRGGIADERRAKRDVTVVATVRSAVEGSASVAGSVMGTPAYMPPEQALGQVDDLTERSDVFSLGAILCEVLTGAPPYTDDVFVAAAQARLDDAHARLDACGAAPELITLGKSCLSALPKDRPRSAREVADVVSSYLAEAESRAHQANLRAAEEEAKSEEQRRARKQTFGIAAAVLTVVLLGGTAWFTIQRSEAQRERQRIGAFEEAVREATRLDSAGEWTGASAAAEQALGLVADDSTRRDEAEKLHARIRANARIAEVAEAKAEREAELLEKLDGILVRHAGDHDWRSTRASYADALPDAAAVAAFERKQELALHFDVHAQTGRNAGGDAWKSADTTARALDPDPWRNRLRSAAATRDAEALRTLAGDPDLASQGVRSLSRLGSMLGIDGDLDTARRILRVAYEKDPGDFWVNHWLGKFAHWDPEDRYRDEAIAHYRAALALRPSPANHNELGIALSDGDEGEAAKRHFREAIRLDPEFAPAHSNLGLQLLEEGDVVGAEKLFRKTIELAPERAFGYYHLGNALKTRGQLDEAIAAYREALQRDETDAQVHNNLANTLIDKGDLDAAIEAYRETLRLDPKLLRAYVNLGFALLRKRDPTAAIREFERAIEVDPEYALAHRSLGGTLSDRGELERAIAALQRAIEIEPNDPAGHRFLAITYGKKGDVPAARNAARRFFHLTILAHSEAGRFEPAAQMFANAIMQDPLLPGEPPERLRYDAACAAARAGAKWHKAALAWLRDDLETWKKATGAGMANALHDWLEDPRLAPVRDVDDLSDEWKQLWTDVRALLK